MEKKNLDWGNLGFGYMTTDYRYVANYKDGKWDDGALVTDPTVTLNECAGVFQYSQSCFEGLKAYTTEDGHIVCFRPDLNASRMKDSCERLEMPVFPEDRFVDAVEQVVKANAAWVPPFGSGATLYIRPYMIATNAVIGVKPACYKTLIPVISNVAAELPIPPLCCHHTLVGSLLRAVDTRHIHCLVGLLVVLHITERRPQVLVQELLICGFIGVLHIVDYFL